MTEQEDRSEDVVRSVLSSTSRTKHQRLLDAVDETIAGISAARAPDAVADELDALVRQCFATDVAVIYRYDAADATFHSTARTEAAAPSPASVTSRDGRTWAAFGGDRPAVVRSGDGRAPALVLPVPGAGAIRIGGVDPAAIAGVHVAVVDHVAPVAVGVADRLRELERAREEVTSMRTENEQLRDFADIVSHDLRNPLAVARGNLELAVETGEAEYVERVEGAHDRIESIVEHTLALAEEGQRVGETIPTDVETIARRAWAVVETADADIAVVESTTIDADPDRLQQLLENLFRNAVEHGSSDATVRVGVLDDTEGFYVEDDGPGIPPTERERVFEQGYTGSDDGTGLGLGVVEEIATAHGWRVEAAASDSGGARFELRT